MVPEAPLTPITIFFRCANCSIFRTPFMMSNSCRSFIISNIFPIFYFLEFCTYKMFFHIERNCTVKDSFALIPRKRIEPGLYSGNSDGSNGWFLIPGITMISLSPWKRVLKVQTTSFMSKISTSSSTKMTVFNSLKADKARIAA